MKLQEKTLTSTTIYDGKVLHVCRDTVLLPNGFRARTGATAAQP